jgi:hypothetical protein
MTAAAVNQEKRTAGIASPLEISDRRRLGARPVAGVFVSSTALALFDRGGLAATHDQHGVFTYSVSCRFRATEDWDPKWRCYTCWL